jgi:hypothetical protein
MMVKILIFLFHKHYTYDKFCMTKIKLSIKFKRMTKSYPYRYLEICPISGMITIEEDHRPLRLTGLLFLRQADLFKCLCGRYRPFDPIVFGHHTTKFRFKSQTFLPIIFAYMLRSGSYFYAYYFGARGDNSQRKSVSVSNGKSSIYCD